MEIGDYWLSCPFWTDQIQSQSLLARQVSQSTCPFSTALCMWRGKQAVPQNSGLSSISRISYWGSWQVRYIASDSVFESLVPRKAWASNPANFTVQKGCFQSERAGSGGDYDSSREGTRNELSIWEICWVNRPVFQSLWVYIFNEANVSSKAKNIMLGFYGFGSCGPIASSL